MESERLLIFLHLFYFFNNSPVGVYLDGMTCICRQETIKNDKECTLLMAGAEVHPLHAAWRVEKHLKSFEPLKCERNILSGATVA